MTKETLTVLVIPCVVAVVVAVFVVLRRERTSTRDPWIAGLSGSVLAMWALVAAVLAIRGAFIQTGQEIFPPVGIALVVAFISMAVCVTMSRSLRGLLSNRKNLTWLHLWRLEGIVFLVLMANGQVPALWALPAGVGDIIVGATAPLVANQLETIGGKRRAILFNLFGMLDLIVAISLGVTTNPGPAQLFHTNPTSELLTHFPLILVPTFLVPLAFTIHVVSLWQWIGGTWGVSART
ncbi:MAG TPA: hypothetical protein VIW67_12475 [Terriglobales bacterium]|jgi:hypothetical protein